MGSVTLHTLELGCGIGPGLTNTYFLCDTETGTVVIIDPAGEAQRIRETLDRLGTPAAILLTHAHYDHLAALGEIQQHYSLPVYCGKGDERLFAYFMEMLSAGLPGFVPGSVDVWMQDSDILAFGGICLAVLSTPGHSSGSVCFHEKEAKLLLSGDTLFYESVGRTDFPDALMRGDYQMLLRSLRHLLSSLPDDTHVYPGHGEPTTIGHEKKYNPFLQGLSWPG